MEKDKIGSISHIVHQDKFQKAQRSKCEMNETIHIWREDGYFPPITGMKKTVSTIWQSPEALKKNTVRFDSIKKKKKTFARKKHYKQCKNNEKWEKFATFITKG